MEKKKILVTFPGDEYEVINSAWMDYIKETNKVLSIQEFIRMNVLKGLGK